MKTAVLPAAMLLEDTPADYLQRLGQAGDGPHDVATAALMLAALDRPDKKLETYQAHLTEIAAAVRANADFARDGESAAQALSSVIAGEFAYEGERHDYDDPNTVDLMTVIDRRRGLPVALGILYLHAARASGIEAQGLYAPGHFLMRIAVKGSEAIIDPFNGGNVLDRERVNTPGFGAPLIMPEPGAGDSPDPFQAVSDCDVLLRLLNNVKNRALKIRDNARAQELLRRMTIIAPRRSVLWLELARMQESSGALSGAHRAYENCVRFARAGDVISNEATFALHAIKRRLN